MIHVLAMAVFAFFVGVVFAVVTKESLDQQVRYGAKVFLAFMLIGLGLAWLMFPAS